VQSRVAVLSLPNTGGTPCIRFGNTIASDHIVDATITQDSTSHTWTGFRFAKFSDWVSVFHGGTGTIVIKEHGSTTVLLKADIPLTPGDHTAVRMMTKTFTHPGVPYHSRMLIDADSCPGPLVVVVKDTWPPHSPTNIETIAASFVPPKTGSAVRLFNLASAISQAGLKDQDGKTLAANIKYTLG
jgi:hypothetical protein